jgi:hypothetical protein
MSEEIPTTAEALRFHIAGLEAARAQIQRVFESQLNYQFGKLDAKIEAALAALAKAEEAEAMARAAAEAAEAMAAALAAEQETVEEAEGDDNARLEY